MFFFDTKTKNINSWIIHEQTLHRNLKMGVGWSFRKCRDCLATREDVQNKVSTWHCVYMRSILRQILVSRRRTYTERSSKLRLPLQSSGGCDWSSWFYYIWNQLSFYLEWNWLLPCGQWSVASRCYARFVWGSAYYGNEAFTEEVCLWRQVFQFGYLQLENFPFHLWKSRSEE